MQKGNYQKAKTWYDSAYDIAKKSGDKEIIGSSLIGIASVYSSTSNFSKSLDYMLQAARISEEIHHTSTTSLCYANAASLFGSEANDAKSAEYARKALDISRSFRLTPDRTQAMGKSYECLGVVAANQEHMAEARSYYDSALAIYQKAGMLMAVANKTGLGLHVVRELARAIGCLVSVNSHPGRGMQFVLSLVD